jgi:hypothetical protein
VIKVSGSVSINTAALEAAINAALPAAAEAFKQEWPGEVTRQGLVDTGALRDGLSVSGNGEVMTLSFPSYGAFQFLGFTTRSGTVVAGKNVPDIIIASQKPLQAALRAFQVLQ